MPYPLKKERNKKLVKLRNQDPKKWTFEALAREFNIKKPTAYQVFQRTIDKELAVVDKGFDKG